MLHALCHKRMVGIYGNLRDSFRGSVYNHSLLLSRVYLSHSRRFSQLRSSPSQRFPSRSLRTNGMPVRQRRRSIDSRVFCSASPRRARLSTIEVVPRRDVARSPPRSSRLVFHVLIFALTSALPGFTTWRDVRLGNRKSKARTAVSKPWQRRTIYCEKVLSLAGSAFV